MTASNRTYYRDATGSTFRIVEQLTPDCFVVVKVFEGRVRTVKFWRGELNATAQYWSTKVFEPSAQGKRLLDAEFEITIQEFGPIFQLALSL